MAAEFRSFHPGLGDVSILFHLVRTLATNTLHLMLLDYHRIQMGRRNGDAWTQLDDPQRGLPSLTFLTSRFPLLQAVYR